MAELKTAGIDHFFHLAAVYDMTADEERNRIANVEGTRNAVELANALEAGRFHHASSIAAAGLYKGLFREDMFDEGQKLDHPYHRTKFESEKLARTQTNDALARLSPGDRRRQLRRPARWTRSTVRTTSSRRSRWPGTTCRAGSRWSAPSSATPTSCRSTSSPTPMDHIAHQPGLDGQAFHLTNPKSQRSGEVMNTFAKAAHAPQLSLRIDSKLLKALPKGTIAMLMQLPAAKGVRKACWPTSGSPTRSSATSA